VAELTHVIGATGSPRPPASVDLGCSPARRVAARMAAGTFLTHLCQARWRVHRAAWTC